MQLEIVDREGRATTHRLDGDGVVLGRAPGDGVTIEDDTVSRRHALLSAGADGPVVRDLDSSNGTYVNDRRVAEQPLRDGDRLRLGDAEAVVGSGTIDFHREAAPALRSAPAPAPAPPRVAPRQAPGSATEPLRAVASGTITIGRSPEATIVLEETTVSRLHARVELRDGRAVLSDAGSSNGTYVNGERVTTRVLVAGDVVWVGPARLRFDGQALVRTEGAQGFRIDAIDLGRVAGATRILTDVDLSFAPDQLACLVGASGAGKSTILRCLAGLWQPNEGVVLYDGDSLLAAYDAYRPLIGFVPQSDVLHPVLPVGVALDYAARLRLPRDLTRADRHARIDQVLADVGMLDRRHLPIQKLSGGQRKRVSVALELLASPRVLLLDEPTSGLDPHLEKQLMQLFRGIASGGCTVVVVTHATASLDLADQAVFLAPGGRVAYAGPPRSALDWFGASDYADCYATIGADPLSAATRYAASAPSHTPPSPASAPRLRRPRTPQLLLLTRRYVELIVRDSRNLVLLMLQAPALGGLLAVAATRHAWTDRQTGPAAAQQVAFAIATIAVWFGLLNAAREVVKDRPVFERERAGALRIVPYLASRVIVLFAVLIVQCVVLLSLVELRVGDPPHTSATVITPYVDVLMTLVLAGAAAVAGALVVSCVVKNEDRATTAVPFLLVPQFLLAGVSFHLTWPVSLLERLTFTHWATGAIGDSVGVGNRLCVGARCTNPLGISYSTSQGAVILRWLVLAGFAAVLLAVCGALLTRRER